MNSNTISGSSFKVVIEEKGAGEGGFFGKIGHFFGRKASQVNLKSTEDLSDKPAARQFVRLVDEVVKQGKHVVLRGDTLVVTSSLTLAERWNFKKKQTEATDKINMLFRLALVQTAPEGQHDYFIELSKKLHQKGY